jgi:biopolymer transport protein ExbD
MRFSSGRSRRVAIEMTPLIDVVLMLVIFFMLTTTFVLSPGIEVDLPQGSTSQKPRELDAVITMTKAGAIYYQEAPVSLETLGAVLQRARQAQPELRVVIKADTLVPHGRVVAVMDLAKHLGIDHLAVATAPPEPTN